MSKLFYLNGIKSPGRVNLKDLGDVNLEDISDEMALKLFNEGCPFLVPSPEGFKVLYPDLKVISVEKLAPKKKRTRKK